MAGRNQRIAADSAALIEHVRAAAERCSDKRLKADLFFLCDRIPTIATQLKIIASVKAAAVGGAASDADALLVSSAQNLMDAVHKTVKACEAASLKQLPPSALAAARATANDVAETVQWRIRPVRSEEDPEE